MRLGLFISCASLLLLACPGGGGGTAPRVTIKQASSAAPQASDGAPCSIAADCASGVCEGQGCAPGQGRCSAKNRICTRDLRQYCGCDGTTFNASGSCPGRRYRQRGPCQP